MENEEINKREPVSIGDWLITLIVSAIPIVGFIMLFVWAFSSGIHPSKTNWAKATLIFIAIFFVLGIIFLLIFGAAMFGFMENEMMNTEY
ncbi:MAG TPA: hypothetical protein VK212_09025 [Lentimicrobium sp.]|nr:hypothetical protein [Lentimicrobium sp.]